MINLFRLVMDRCYRSVDDVRMSQVKNLDVHGTLRKDRGLPQALRGDVRAHPLEDGEFRWMMAPSNPTLSLHSASSTTHILSTNWKGSQEIVCGAGP